MAAAAAWTLIWVIGAVVTVTWRAKLRKSRDCPRLLPRFFLILKLQENLGTLLAAVEPDNRKAFCYKILETLKTVRKHLGGLEQNLQVQDGLKIASEKIDEELVTSLQKVPRGPSILEGYLPKAGQTWDALLKEKGEDERRFLDAENDNKEMQKDVTRSWLHAIDLLVHELQQAEEFYKDDRFRPYFVIQQGTRERVSYDVVKVFYATDRQVTEDGDYIGAISSRVLSDTDESNDDLSLGGVSPLQFGVAEIGIPKTHKVGNIEGPRSLEESSPLKHVVILSVDTKLRGNRLEFLKIVNGDLEQSDLLIFIHGFNVSHKQALKRAAQLKYDLQFRGAMIAYSWSSKGELLDYYHDQKTVNKTVGHLRGFLLSIMHEVHAARVHILAHSMGNRALIGALNLLHNGEIEIVRNPRVTCRLSEIIFAAADEQPSAFEDLIKNMSQVYTSSADSEVSNSNDRIAANSPPHLTVYCSTDDWPLSLSMYLHDFKRRLGDTWCFLQSDASVDSHDVVDASGVDIDTGLRHSYYSDSREVLQDLQVLLTQRLPASQRPKLHEIKHIRRTFYAFNTTKWAGRLSSRR